MVSWSGLASYLRAAHSTFLERTLGYVISADVAIFTPVAGERAANARRTPTEEKNKREFHERSVVSTLNQVICDLRVSTDLRSDHNVTDYSDWLCLAVLFLALFY